MAELESRIDLSMNENLTSALFSFFALKNVVLCLGTNW